MRQNSAEEEYVILLLEEQADDHASALVKQITSGELRLCRKNTVASNLTTLVLSLLAFSVIAFFAAFLSGLAWHLLQWAW